MDINYWFITSTSLVVELYAALAKVEVSTFGVPVVPVAATQFPRLNHLEEQTKKVFKATPIWYDKLGTKTVGDLRLISSYSFDTEYGMDTPVREDFKELEEAYPDDFLTAGAWDVATGQPVGGVGSPWFLAPPDLINYMPDVPQPPNGDLGPPDRLYDVNLVAGQAPRNFI